jgi:uncharacterized protein YodC (DUF2158 family)
MNELKEGDVVRLNSGGPDMTVLEVSGDTAVCKWHDGNEFTSATFRIVCLTPVEPKTPEAPSSIPCFRA